MCVQEWGNKFAVRVDETSWSHQILRQHTVLGLNFRFISWLHMLTTYASLLLERFKLIGEFGIWNICEKLLIIEQVARYEGKGSQDGCYYLSCT